jgi:dTDP-3-amino-3,4,6-trideoxy-alpha-D-glucose transaminase
MIGENGAKSERKPLIPFRDLRASVEELHADLNEAYERVLTRGSFVQGQELEAFEEEFAAACGADFAVGVGSGTDALTLVMKALEIGSGDEVIVPAHTCIATWLAVSATGAQVVPVEPREGTFLIDPALVEAAITARTAAIIPVHLYGESADMLALLRIGKRHGIPVVVDAAQATGIRNEVGQPSVLGRAAAFSFYPTKNIGALGDGGAVVTNDHHIATKVRMLRNYGSLKQNHHEILGVNSRLDELQAAFLRCQLPRLGEWNSRRAKLAGEYCAWLAPVSGISLPQMRPQSEHVWHLFTIVVRDGRRESLRSFLEKGGVETRIYYPVPPHRSPAYAASLNMHLPIAERLAESIVSLPLHPQLRLSEALRICDLVARWSEQR